MRNILIILSLIVTASFSFAQDDAEQSRVRVGHFAADAPNVDVWVDGVTVLENIAPNSISAWLELEPGEHTIAASVVDIGDVVIEADVELEAGHSYTVAAVGSIAEDNLDALVIDETAAIADSELSEGALLIIINNITGAPALDFYEDGQTKVDDAAYGEASITLLAAGNWDTGGAVSADGDETPVFVFDDQDDELGGYWEPNTVYLFGLSGIYPGAMFEDYGITSTHYSPSNVVDFLAGFSGLGLSYNGEDITEFNTLLAAAAAAGLAETLRESEGFTLFAPTDQAFAALPEGALDTLMSDPEMLATVLQNHLVLDDLTYDELIEQGTFTTMMGDEVTFRYAPDEFGAYLNEDIFIETFDYPAANGRVYVLHDILLPDDMTLEGEAVSETTEEAEG